MMLVLDSGSYRPIRAVRGPFRSTLLCPKWRTGIPSHKRAVRRRMQRLARIFERVYGTPDLGNLADPLDEAIYILITYQTDLERARAVWAELKARFPLWRDVLSAPAAELERVLRPSGFQLSRARLIRSMLQVVRRRWGALSLQALEMLDSERAEVELRALPGLDIKGARCVLMYALGRAAFPVDSNVFRFMRRYGVVASSARYRRKSTHDELQDLVAPSDRYRFHVNLVVHGQRTCVPRNPRCGSCVVQRTCSTGRDSSRRA